MADLTFTVADLLHLLDMLRGKEAIALMKFKEACGGFLGKPFDAEQAYYYSGLIEGLSFARGHIYELFVLRLKAATNDNA